MVCASTWTGVRPSVLYAISKVRRASLSFRIRFSLSPVGSRYTCKSTPAYSSRYHASWLTLGTAIFCSRSLRPSGSVFSTISIRLLLASSYPQDSSRPSFVRVNILFCFAIFASRAGRSLCLLAYSVKSSAVSCSANAKALACWMEGSSANASAASSGVIVSSVRLLSYSTHAPSSVW